ncbi:beta-glucanase/beta-glucan synthetase [Actinobacteria bacterium IMCC26207]|nr:beta-glucanase/beta-glucan synthetase [Actinobacteria bacterium IMCC26207]
MERGQTKTSRGVALLLALACAAQLLVLTVGTQAATAATGPTAWSLSWSDEFNTAASARPDSSRWGYDLGGGGFGNAERQYYTDRPENISSDGTGNLAITARKETLAGSSCWYGTCQYTSGRVLTKNKFTQRYGRFESRMKLPAGQGVWPAFWMQGDDSGSAGTAWPGRGELDIMENVGYEPSSVHGSLHGPGYSGGSAITKGYTLPGGAKFSDAFHTFSVEWAPNEVRWYVDDVLYETRTPADLPAGSPWVFDHPFYILMNFAVGGQWPGDPSASTAFPQALLVDYVRVYTPTTTTTLPVTAVRSALSRIEAESFDAQSGVAKEATIDTGGGQNIGWIANGDSVTYRNVDFGSSGVSGVTARVASAVAAGVTGTAELHLDSASGPIVGMLSLTSTGGWQTWASKSATVTGAVGVHDLVAVFRSNQLADFTNLNWLSFTAPAPATTTTVPPTTVPTTTVPPTTTTTTVPPTTVPTTPTRDAYSRIESESSDASVGTIKETTTDLGGGQDIGWIANGDNATYRRVNFGSSGETGVTARVASGAAAGVSGAIEFRLDSATGPKVGEFSIANTGGWQTWKSVPANVSGATGIHDLYVVARSGQPADFVNLNWMTFTRQSSTVPATTVPTTVAPTTTVPPTTTIPPTTVPPTTVPTTTIPPTTVPPPTTIPATTGSFPFVFANNTGGRWSNSQIYVTVLGQSSPGQWSYLKADGSIAPINHLEATAPGHLTKNGQDYPNMSFRVDQAPSVRLASRMEGARMYLSLGSPLYIPVSADDKGWGGPNVNDPGDPNTDIYFDWYEFTYRDGVYAFGGNTTQVDQFGFPMTARIEQTSTGYDQTVGTTATRAEVYAKYAATVDPAFANLASTYRILAPRTSPAFHGSGPQANYLQSTIDQTWAYYTTHAFTLTRLGQTFTGKVVGTQLQFTKDGTGPYILNKPSSADVFECSGALASGGMRPVELEMGAEFCAAFNRGVAINTADWYRPAAYYPAGPKNDFSAVFHTLGIGGRAYGFAYDDVADQSSVKILPNAKSPTRVTIGIGW